MLINLGQLGLSTRRAGGGGGLPTPLYDLNFADDTYVGGIIDYNNAYNNDALIRNYAGYDDRYVENKDGSYVYQKGAILKRSDRGIWVLPYTNNNILYARDLTNAVWVKTNITATKNQTGFLDDANGATLITATADNATILQSLTLASSNYVSTAFVQRVSGSGDLQMTEDGGTTWNTLPVSTTLQRIKIPVQTVTNPQVGFRIATNGDSFVIDCVQTENGSSTNNLAGNPVPTTSATVAKFRERPASYVTGNNDLGELMQGAFGFYMELSAERVETFGPLVSDNGSLQARVYEDGSAKFNEATTAAGQFTRGLDTVNKIAGYINADGTVGVCVNGNAVANATGQPLATTMTHCDFGTNGNGSEVMHGYFARISFYAGGALSDADLVELTTLPPTTVFISLTQSEYDAITTKNPEAVYCITELGGEVALSCSGKNEQSWFDGTKSANVLYVLDESFTSETPLTEAELETRSSFNALTPVENTIYGVYE